ncbi:hypothetical protein [Acetobacter sp.]|jgi:hypothetical protein|uniref:hypothetical protein n=1 Tax=Acetobacter sp. TaxID=440 RepID=UPI0025C3E114|nr:hypothetical protein [Acetobacter sp.]MCH4090313.1 hypothetical protein [Acetobacter sp.]MCI1299007.1 hypothetical protein [Acetobacter sp.]MCI1315027.1 hypothetical protein [Acetobacter sp.]
MIRQICQHLSTENDDNNPDCVFMVSTLREACGALRAVQGNGCSKVILISPPAAAGCMGGPWWMAMMTQCRSFQDQELASPAFVDILDCGSQAGRAVSALTRGQKHIVFDPASPQRKAVEMLAASLGATVLFQRPDTIQPSPLGIVGPSGE